MVTTVHLQSISVITLCLLVHVCTWVSILSILTEEAGSQGNGLILVRL